MYDFKPTNCIQEVPTAMSATFLTDNSEASQSKQASEEYDKDDDDQIGSDTETKLTDQSSCECFLMKSENPIETEAAGVQQFMNRTMSLPRSMLPIGIDTSNNICMTLPISTPAPRRVKPRRQVWLKPVTYFVAFMSHIGDNVHITSYPQS